MAEVQKLWDSWSDDAIETFIREVVPILQKRGLFRTDYSGNTLREHYGLDRPDSQFFADTDTLVTRQVRLILRAFFEFRGGTFATAHALQRPERVVANAVAVNPSPDQIPC